MEETTKILLILVKFFSIGMCVLFYGAIGMVFFAFFTGKRVMTLQLPGIMETSTNGFRLLTVFDICCILFSLNTVVSTDLVAGIWIYQVYPMCRIQQCSVLHLNELLAAKADNLSVKLCLLNIAKMHREFQR